MAKVELNGEMCFRSLSHLRRRPESRRGNASTERSVRAVRTNDVCLFKTVVCLRC